MHHFVLFCAPFIALWRKIFTEIPVVSTIISVVLVETSPLIFEIAILPTIVILLRLIAVFLSLRKVIWRGVFERLQDWLGGLGQPGNYIFFFLLSRKLALADQHDDASEQLVHLCLSFLFVLKFLKDLQEGLRVFLASRNFFKIFLLWLLYSCWLGFLRLGLGGLEVR